MDYFKNKRPSSDNSLILVPQAFLDSLEATQKEILEKLNKTNIKESITGEYVSEAEAKEQLIESLTGYEAFFNSDPDASTVHPRFGKLNYSEWKKFHPKHFKHHFEQFGVWE